ncbi:MAG: delta-60 repeat domain-containing protein, partial [Desulfobulbus sp.]|nr:delta-60 repeat domain-containing protein [Desulfobulbus sp.]
MACRILVFLVLWALVTGCGEQAAWAFPQLDASFGLNGRVAVELGGRNSGHAVLVQPDGKILVAGSSSQHNALNFSLLRFNADGTLDPGFNGDGTAIISLSPGDDEALVLGLLSDGRIVAAGYAYNGRDRDLAMICFHPDGKLDRSFGDEGVVLTSIGNGNEEITAMTISPSDMITVAGSTEGTSGRILVVARFTSSGVPDDGFGEQGVSLIAVGKDASVEGILERPDGTFVLSGSYAEEKSASAMLVGLHADGSVDTAFGKQGVAIPAGGFAASEGYGIAADRRGRLYVAGSVGLAGRRDAALFRFTAQGEADASFGDRGVTVTSVSREDDLLYG